MLVCAGVAVTLTFCPFNFKSHRLLSNSLSLSHSHTPSCLLQTLNTNLTSVSDDALRLSLASAAAVASAIHKASTSPVEFSQRFQNEPQTGLVLPSTDFHRLCLHQLHLLRRILPESLLSVYVRPAGSYVMDRLELRRVALYPGDAKADGIVILVGHFNIPAGLRAAEATLSNLQVNIVPEYKALVLPMVKHPFVVGFLVAELPLVEQEQWQKKPQSDQPDNFMSIEESYSLPPLLDLDKKSREIKTLPVKDGTVGMLNFTSEQRSNAVNISQSLAMAYVMDQKAMLLQQSSWQNNVRMGNLVEQIRGPLSSIQTLSKILSTQTKRTQISYDIVEDLLVHGDRLRDVLQQLQDAVYLTKTNIVRYNEEAIKKMNGSTHILAESGRSQLLDSSPGDVSANKMKKSSKPLSLGKVQDIEMPLPPLALAPLQHGIRSCNVSEVLTDLVDSVRPLAQSQKRVVELSELSSPLLAAVEEVALRQAFSNLIEGALLRTHVGGRVEIVSTAAPAGGTLVLIDDDGPDMHYMTQMRSLAPYGQELLSDGMIEDNMTWNFVAGLTVAREILESYGSVVRIVSPLIKDAPLGAGGTRVELWLPSSMVKSDLSSHAQEV